MKRVPLPTGDELMLVKDFILLPILLDVLERDIKLLAVTPLKMPAIYIKSFRNVQDRIIEDLHDVRKKLRKCGFKVYDPQRTETSIEAEYVCRGYCYRFAMLWGLVKAEVEKKLSFYMHVNDPE